MITRKELIKKYLEFFKSKNHAIIPSASLIPENDPTTLFISAGMQPLVPYLLGQKHPLGKRLVNVQKCIRTGDIEEVGDSTHHTFFEMLGNWSLGDYWKKEAIEYSFEFLTKILKIPVERLATSVFKGDTDAPKDIESVKIWQSLGIPKEKIAFLGKEDNWWGPAGKTGPCGPDTEIFYWKSNQIPAPKKFNPKDERWVEIWNDVFMQYNKTAKGKYEPLKQKNVDTGMGVERTVAILNGFQDNYLTEIWQPIIKHMEKLSGKKYKGNEKTMRIIADHIKAAVFLFDEEVSPDHKERGYVLRRLIRRAIIYGKKLGLRNFTSKVAESVFDIYPDYFPKKGEKIRFVNRNNREFILDEIGREEMTFLYTIENGLKVLKNMITHQKKISATDAFLLFQSYGFPVELTQEIIKSEGLKINVIKFVKEFEKELAKHQKLSRTATKGKFTAGLADHSEKTTKYHTATHLLHKALKIILGEEVKQMGSNITQERLRFDFKHDSKLTNEEKKKVEDLVNEQIKKSLPVSFKEMPYTQATKIGALSYFRERYPNIVKVYIVGDFSKEICTGPHVKNTKELGKFKIIKEESVSAGVRRIRAVLE